MTVYNGYSGVHKEENVMRMEKASGIKFLTLKIGSIRTRTVTIAYLLVH